MRSDSIRLNLWISLMFLMLMPRVGQAQSGPQDGAAGDEGCTPECRSGYTCVEGSCVSACNPPCGSDETCTDAGECVAKRPPEGSTTLVAAKPMTERKGLYLTTGLGGGGLYVQTDYEGTGQPEDGTETYSGGGLSLEGAIGGGTGKGWVLGASIVTLLGGGSYTDDYVNTRVSGVTGGSELGGMLSTVTGHFFAQKYFGPGWVRFGVGGGGVFVIGDFVTESTGGGSLALAAGADYPLSAGLTAGFSVGAHGLLTFFSDDEYEGTVVGIQPSVRFQLSYF